MTDLNTKQYLYNQPYLQNQPAYGDGKAGFPVSIDDKRLDPVKDNLKANPVGKVMGGVSDSKKENDMLKMPTLLALGAIPTFLIDKACKKLIKGESFKESALGKTVAKIDNFSNTLTARVPALKFTWAKNAFERVKNSNGIISQIINATPTKPVNGMAKGMVIPMQDAVIKELFEEAVNISKHDPKVFHGLTKALDEGVKGSTKEAYKMALKLAGKNPSEKFLRLKNRAHSLSSMSKHSTLSKLLINGFNGVSRIFNIGQMGAGVSGKLGPLFGFAMTAYFLGQTVKNVIDAPKGEKGSTLAHGIMVDFIAGWLLFEPIMRFMHKGIGALKGVNSTGLKQIITKPMNWAGKLLNTGLDKKAIPENLGKIAKGFKHTGRFLKGFGGGAGRFAIMMFVLFPVVDKIARFVTHNIFGKPNALLAKEKAETESGKTENTETNNADALKKALEQHKSGMLTVAAKNSAGTANPMIEKYLKQQGNANEAAFKASELNPAPAQEVSQKQQYIPSDTKKNQLEEQQKKAKFDATLANIDSVIKNAEKTLGS